MKDLIIESGPLKGKRVELAQTARVARLHAVSEDFMRRIFGWEPEDYLITDESSLSDFADPAKARQKILSVYGSMIDADNLAQIFEELASRLPAPE